MTCYLHDFISFLILAVTHTNSPFPSPPTLKPCFGQVKSHHDFLTPFHYPSKPHKFQTKKKNGRPSQTLQIRSTPFMFRSASPAVPAGWIWPKERRGRMGQSYSRRPLLSFDFSQSLIGLNFLKAALWLVNFTRPVFSINWFDRFAVVLKSPNI